MATNGGSVVFTFEADDKKINSALSGLGKGIGTAAKAGAVAMGTLATAITGVVAAGVKSYADLEQNVGGIETLFKDSADTVIANAKKAYETAGMSANEYMQTVTSFSASLLQSLGGDTAKAAEVADMAIVDMADNANKMGTSMELIQNAYQGFAKQNYTMLDNLKLGYGGTKEEMERLLADAEKISGIHYDISSLNDVYQAIHVIQQNMDITGTTAKEASETISGSFSAAKAAFDNFLNGSGDVETLADTLVTSFGNVGKAIVKLTPQITNGLVKLVNGLIPEIPGLISGLLPAVLDGALQIIQGLINIAPQLLTTVLNIIQGLLTSLATQLPTIAQSLFTGLVQIVNSLAQSFPTLIPTLVSAILGLIPVLLENLPTFINAGINLLLGLAQGLINAIPTLISYLPQIISSLISGILANLPQLISSGIQLIIALAQGLIQAIPQLVASIPQLLLAIVDGIISGVGQLLDAGKDLVKGLWDGITGSFDWIKKKIKGWVGNVLDFIKGLFGIHSPSTEFAYFGRMNVLGLEEGMEDMEGSLNATIGDMVNLSPSLLASASNSYNPNVNVVVNNQFEQDPLGQMVQRRKTFASGAKNDYNFGMGV